MGDFLGCAPSFGEHRDDRLSLRPPRPRQPPARRLAARRARARKRGGRRVDVAHKTRNLCCRQRFPAAPEAIAARRGRSVDVEARTGRQHRKQKELISREIAEPSGGLEPPTPLYEEGPCVKWRRVHRPVRAVAVMVGGERCSSLYRLLVGGQGRLEFAPVAHLLKDRQAARGSVAPLGAKGSLRVSMCQIASASRRARSTWATLAPRCLPMRAFVC
jgi:hypothetical protein